ncbi:hypothetical protein C8N40_11235 [Pontibacter mucosus]|uniref:Uncharacterized protein n=2 Tax=Pontibacter mucosus TaxID=1649266 RepID=A0A2T5YCH9_9BACT|nr:hypothetical protein C8N40_11235 [Pontibacter mucosus]
MKNLKISFIFLFALAASSCQQQASVQEVMESESQRKQVYATIMDNPEMRQEMMQAMRAHPQGGMMMRGGRMGRGPMMGDTTMMMSDTARMGGMSRENMRTLMQQMIAACAEDSANCNQMAQMMTQHRQMMQGMMHQMRQKGMMGENCYQQVMKNMSQTTK